MCDPATIAIATQVGQVAGAASGVMGLMSAFQKPEEAGIGAGDMEARAKKAADAKRKQLASAGRGSLLQTGGLGVTEEAPVAKKTLLGA